MNAIELPLLSTAQMRTVERLMIEVYGIDPLQTMENAGRNLAMLAKRHLDDDIIDRSIVLLIGPGNHAGVGLAAARHLLNGGAWVQILLSHPSVDYTGVAARQLVTLRAMDAPLAWAEEGWELPPADLVLDIILGGELDADPQGKARDLIQLANSSVAPILSLDAPSGLDITRGQLYTPHIRAAATLALALPKAGLISGAGQSACGDLYVADVGVPPQLYASLGLEVPMLFARDSIYPICVLDGKVMMKDGK